MKNLNYLRFFFRNAGACININAVSNFCLVNVIYIHFLVTSWLALEPIRLNAKMYWNIEQLYTMLRM